MIRLDSNTIEYTAIISCVFFLLYFAGTAYCQEDGTALMLEIVPSDGGYLNIAPGVHSYDRYAYLTLNATPNPGYQFVYWMGNVTEATASSTSVYLDGPRIVIAVFERSKFTFDDMEERPQPSLSGGGLIPSAPDYPNAGGGGGGGKRPSKFRRPKPPKPNEDIPVPEEGGDFPVPGEDGDFPTPIPEPGTITFVVTGLLIIARRRRRGQTTPNLTL